MVMFTEEKASTIDANAEKTAPEKAAEKAAFRAAAFLRFHTCSNDDCAVMRLRPWLPAKGSKTPRRMTVHEGWPHTGIEALVGGQVTAWEFSSPPSVTVAFTERERHISVKGYPHEWLVGGEGTPNAGLAAHLCHGCMRPSVVALTCTLQEATLPAKVLLSSDWSMQPRAPTLQPHTPTLQTQPRRNSRHPRCKRAHAATPRAPGASEQRAHRGAQPALPPPLRAAVPPAKRAVAPPVRAPACAGGRRPGGASAPEGRRGSAG